MLNPISCFFKIYIRPVYLSRLRHCAGLARCGAFPSIAYSRDHIEVHRLPLHIGILIGCRLDAGYILPLLCPGTPRLCCTINIIRTCACHGSPSHCYLPVPPGCCHSRWDGRGGRIGSGSSFAGRKAFLRGFHSRHDVVIHRVVLQACVGIGSLCDATGLSPVRGRHIWRVAEVDVV